jgi:cell division protein FtsL
MRLVNLAAFALALASAFLLYGINYDARLLEARVQGEEHSIDEARNDIAVLKAERAHLARPERIEPIACAQGLQPAAQQQLAPSPEEAMTRALAQAGAARAPAAKGH